MQIERNLNYKKNIVVGIASKLILIILPLATRTCLINILGIEYVGLNGLFSSILQVLSLTELGFGSAMVYSMYKPVAENNFVKLSALLNLYKRVYLIIGSVILGIGLCLLPFLSYLIQGHYPDDINLTLLYVVYLLNTVSGYFIFAYRSALLNAYQKGYITSWISCVCYSGLYILQIVVLFISKSYYCYIILMPITSISINLVSAVVSKRKYPQIKCRGNLATNEVKGIFESVYALMWHKIGNTLIYSFDSVVISSYLGLAVLGKYNNYYYVYNAIASIFSILYSSVTAGIGNSIVSENKEVVKRQFELFTFGNMVAAGFCSTCLLCLYQDFMDLWTGNENMFPDGTMILMVVYFYIWHSRRMIHTYKDAAGLWKEDKFRPLAEGVCNLILNIVLVNFIGIDGVIISTLICMLLVGIPWEIKVFIKDFCHMSISQYIRTLLKHSFVTGLISCAVYLIFQNVQVNGYLTLIVKALMCAAATVILLLIVYFKDSKFRHLYNVVLKR